MFRFAMWSWARLAGAGEQNSSEVRRDLAGEGWGKGLGTTRGRFGVLDRAVVAPASSSPAAREGRPRRSLFRRGCGLGKERDGSGSYCSYEGRWRTALLVLRPAGTRSSPRQPLMAPAAAQAVDGGRMRSSPCGASFIVARCSLLRGVEKGGPGTGSAWGGARAARTGRPTGSDRRSVQCLSGRAA
jgi:hypothetical protein